ncbi:MAG: efflux RND transporter permease subunit, partial [Acidobacteria bacterium]|nr:efflux RND transporter permease subunit [Acidobacteriota bacterium]MDW7984675.1 efflux RND transporter permease subunit [Acidobacteriota bacterium]
GIQTTPTDVLPDLQSPIFQVFVEAPGLAPGEVDLLLSLPIESALRGLPQVVRTRSVSAQDLGTVLVQFEWGVDFHRAYQWIVSEVARLQPALPPQVTTISVSNALTRIAEVYEISLWSDRLSLKELREWADYRLGLALRQVPGVFKFITQGGYVRQWEVLVSPTRLQQYRLTLTDVVRAIEQDNENFFGSVWIRESQEIPIVGWGRLGHVADLEDIVVRTVQGTPVRLKDVATVRDGEVLRRGAFLVGDHEGVHVLVTKQFGISTAPFLRALEQAIEDLRRTAPPGLHIRAHYNQLELIQTAVRSLAEALAIGLIAVFLVLWGLMGNVRMTLVMALVMPVSILVAFIFLEAFGYSLNVMTLGALAVALGIMIDAAIIDVENIFRHWQRSPHDPIQAVVEGALEVRRPVVYSTLIIMLIFVPFLLLPELAGRLFAPFAATVILSVAIGFVLSVTLTPALGFLLLPRRRSQAEGQDPWVVRVLRAGYAAVLRRVLGFPGNIVAGLLLLLLLGLTVWMVPRLKTRLFPTLDEGAFWIAMDAPPDISLDKNVEVGRTVQRVLREVPDVEEVYTKIGRTEGAEHAERVNRLEVFVRLVPPHRRTQSLEEIRQALRAKLVPLGIPFEVTTPLIGERIQEAIAGVPADLMVRIYGDDDRTLDRVAQELERALLGIPGLVDVRRAQTSPVSQLVIRPDRLRAGQWGLSIEDIGRTVETALGGRVVTSVVRDVRQYGVRVRLAGAGRTPLQNPKDLENLLIGAEDGTVVPLREVARVSLEEVPARILRENLRKMTFITANVAGIGFDEAVRRIQAAIPRLPLPPGYTVDFGGQYESKERLVTQVTWAALGVSLGILIVLLYAFNSWRIALAALFTIPLALSGGVAALFLTGETLNVSSLIGFMAHFGLSVQKALILIEFVLDRLRAGVDVKTACQEAGLVRLRPVLMTALAAGVAVLPIALGYGTGSELQRPLALVLIGGLVTSTPLTLVCLPALLAGFIRPSQASKGEE